MDDNGDLTEQASTVHQNPALPLWPRTGHFEVFAEILHPGSGAENNSDVLV